MIPQAEGTQLPHRLLESGARTASFRGMEVSGMRLLQVWTYANPSLNVLLPCVANGYGRLTAMLTKTSVVSTLMAVAHPLRVLVVLLRASGPMAAARYVIGRYVA